MTNERLPYLEEKTRHLTDRPGCYIMKDKSGTIIYIGKAKNLKKRVTSYFRLNATHLPKVQKMVDNVYDYEYIVTDSEFEALVLECSLIKLNQPKYNILLKDDKGYHYIKISKPPFSKITAEMQKPKKDDGATYLGPYTSGFVVKQSVEEVNKAFKLPQCRRSFPKDFGKQRPCLLYYIKQCSGVCKGNISEEEYQKTLDEAVSYISNDSGTTIKELEDAMMKASDEMRFEDAAVIRDRIEAISKLKEKQTVIVTSAKDQDIIGVVRRDMSSSAVIIKVRDGKIVDKLDFELGEMTDIESGREEFINRYYYDNKTIIPSQITLDGPIENMELTEKHLSELSDRKVTLHIPIRGEQKRLVDMAVQNAAELMSFKTDIYGKDLATLDELAEMTGLSKPPLYIESYDISNLGESHMVGGMVVFENGKPNKKRYKRFTIRNVVGQDDYGAMSEVIERRFRRYLSPNEEDEGFKTLPDLILLDGGLGHVHTIQKVLNKMNIDVPLFGMVKDDKHRTRALVLEDGSEVALKMTSSVYRFLYKIQEEVHRYAITFQRKKHKDSTFKSELTNIEGIGSVRAKNLMKHFKSIEKISNASVEELSEVEGMNYISSENVYRHFNS